MNTPQTLASAAVTVLNTASPTEKVRLSHRFAAAWRCRSIPEPGRADPPDRPARPPRPPLRRPRDMPRRRSSGIAGRIALLHAVAHIELNAIDLAWDLIARFTDPVRAGLVLPRRFFDDWVMVADEEAQHHALLADRLAAHGAAYGDLPAHDGLWQAAAGTAHDLAARLAVVPLVLEARGLDVTPGMIAGLDRAGDTASAMVLQRILDDEIAHVAAGRRWFEHVCAARREEPVATWQALVRGCFKAPLKPPFNTAARDKAGFPAAFYEPLVLPAAPPGA